MTENEKKIFLEWEFFLRSLTDFVQIAKINGIKFEVRTNEQSGPSQTASACFHIQRIPVCGY